MMRPWNPQQSPPWLRERDILPVRWQILLKPSLAAKGPVFATKQHQRDVEIGVEEVAVALQLVIPVSCTWWDMITQKSEPEGRKGGQSLCCPQRDSRVLLSEFTTLFSPTNHLEDWGQPSENERAGFPLLGKQHWVCHHLAMCHSSELEAVV